MRHARVGGMTPISLLCSRSAHTGPIRFEIKGGAPSTGAMGAIWVSSLKETTSKLGRIIYKAVLAWVDGASRRAQVGRVRMTRRDKPPLPASKEGGGGRGIRDAGGTLSCLAQLHAIRARCLLYSFLDWIDARRMFRENSVKHFLVNVMLLCVFLPSAALAGDQPSLEKQELT